MTDLTPAFRDKCAELRRVKAAGMTLGASEALLLDAEAALDAERARHRKTKAFAVSALMKISTTDYRRAYDLARAALAVLEEPPDTLGSAGR